MVPPLLRAFRPDIVVSQHGCDTHRLDPLANLQLSIDAQRVAHAAIHQLAHQVAGGRWVLTGGGGYELLEVVPRTWTHLLAEAAGCPIDPGARIPGTWREYAFGRTGREASQTMTDGTEPEFARFESGYDLADPVDQAIIATRKAVSPEHGHESPGRHAALHGLLPTGVDIPRSEPVLAGIRWPLRAGSGPARTAPEAIVLQYAWLRRS